MSGKKVVHVTRAFKLKREGYPNITFQAGRNEVDADVAEHPYVVAHLTSAPESSGNSEFEAVLAGKNARIDSMQAALNAKDEQIESMGKSLQSTHDALLAMTDANTNNATDLATATARIAELDAVIVAKDAEMAGVLASMKPAAKK